MVMSIKSPSLVVKSQCITFKVAKSFSPIQTPPIFRCLMVIPMESRSQKSPIYPINRSRSLNGELLIVAQVP